MACMLACVWLCNPMDCSQPGFSVHGIFQTRILEWVATSYSRRFSQPKELNLCLCVSCIGRQILDCCTTWGPCCLSTESLRSLTSLCLNLRICKIETATVSIQWCVGKHKTTSLWGRGWEGMTDFHTLCEPMDYTVHGILQARILEWVAFPFSRGSSQPRDWTQDSHTAGGFLYQLTHKGSPRILK